MRRGQPSLPARSSGPPDARASSGRATRLGAERQGQRRAGQGPGACSTCHSFQGGSVTPVGTYRHREDVALSPKWSAGESGTQCPAVSQWSRGLSLHLRGTGSGHLARLGDSSLLKRSERLGAGPGQEGRQGWRKGGWAGRGGSTHAQPRPRPPSVRPHGAPVCPERARPPVLRDGS